MTRKAKRIFFFYLVCAFVMLSACQQSAPQQVSREKKLNVLTTTPVLHCFAMNITGDLANVENLLPSGAEPHEYSLTPLDMKKIVRADILVKNGVGLESWLDRAIESAGSVDLSIVDTSKGVETISNDPHIWLSPANATVQVKNILRALAQADSRNRKLYEKNAENYFKRLEALDEDMREEIRGLRKKEFAAVHPAFLYLARDYGLIQVASVYKIPGQEPSPRHIAELISIIKSKGIKALLADRGRDYKIARAIAGDLSLAIYPLDILEKGTGGPGWYEAKMRENLAILKKVLN